LPIKGKDDEQEFFLTKEMTRQEPQKPSMSKSENEEVLVDSTPSILPKKTLIEKPESVGVLSHDKEVIVDVDPQDQEVVVLSVSQPQDVEDRQAQAQGRRLDALQEFKDRCYKTSGLSGSDAYVDCWRGFVRGDYDGQTCADACGGKCCTGEGACGYFNSDGTIKRQPAITWFIGKGEAIVHSCSIWLTIVLGVNQSLHFHSSYFSLSFPVCKDGSCGDAYSCYGATIPYVVGPSCTGRESCEFARIGSAVSSCNKSSSCRNAQIGSVDSSCTSTSSCFEAQLKGIELINSCNAGSVCKNTNKKGGSINPLIDCCNDEAGQCRGEYGNDIVADGCVSHRISYEYCD